MRKYGEVLDYRTASKAVVGKQYILGNYLRLLQETPQDYIPEKLCEVCEQNSNPFVNYAGCAFQFCREVIEEEVLMTNRQLAEWLARGNGQMAYLKNEYEPKEGIDLEPVFTTHEYDGKYDDEPCGEAVRIRPWVSSEWVVPTLEMYERDCKGSIPWA